MNPISKIVHFNQLAGNERKKRNLKDPLVKAYFDFNCEEFDELSLGYGEENLEEVLDALADLTVTAMGMIHVLGYNPHDILNEVCDANSSKFCNTESEAQQSVESYADNPRYTDVHYVGVNGKYVIKGKLVELEDGDYKILKGINTRKPDLKTIIGDA